MEEKLIGLQADLLRAMAHPTRVKLLSLLVGGERCVCELLDELQLEQSNVSQHLALLRQAGLVSSRRDGSKVIYALRNPHVGTLLKEVTRAVSYSLQEIRGLIEWKEGAQ